MDQFEWEIKRNEQFSEKIEENAGKLKKNRQIYVKIEGN
jgi:hypothetical protein